MLIIIYIFTIFLVLYYSINITTFDKNHAKHFIFHLTNSFPHRFNSSQAFQFVNNFGKDQGQCFYLFCWYFWRADCSRA